MNPLPGSPPHLLYVDEVNVDARDDDAFVGHVECPFPTVTATRYHELTKPLHRTEYQNFEKMSERTVFTVLAEKHEFSSTVDGYCCRPSTTYACRFPLRWKNPLNGKREVCATIEVGHIPIGICGYAEVISNVGLVDALCWWRDWDQYKRGTGPWPKSLPSKPGVHPVYYWCDGYGDGFSDGLTLDLTEAWRTDSWRVRSPRHANPTFP